MLLFEFSSHNCLSVSEVCVIERMKIKTIVQVKSNIAEVTT